MNLKPIFSKMLTAAKKIGGNGWLFAKKHAPEFMIGGGIIGFGLTIWQTINATNKTRDILEAGEEEREYRRDVYGSNDGHTYTVTMYERDLEIIRKRTKLDIIKTWVPVVTLGGTSVILILGGYKIINGRYVASVAAYKLLESRFDHYRGNVIEKYGEDVDHEMYYTLSEAQMAQEQEAQAKREEESKKEKKALKRPRTAYERHVCDGIFDSRSPHWQRYWTPEQALHYVKQKQNELQDRAELQHHLFVNEANDAFDFPRTKEGQVLGWIIDKDHPNVKVSMGVDELTEEELRVILSAPSNDDIHIPIRMNPMGNILEFVG